MRSTLLLALAAVLPVHGFAAELTLPLTKASLVHWELSGTSADRVTDRPLVLPAGAQLSRSFAVNRLAVAWESNPQIAVDPRQWPVIELGNAALVFARDGAKGYLALAVGSADVVVHPHVVVLDADGRGLAPLQAVLRREGGRISLEAAGQRIELEAAPQDAFEVTLSSGAQHAWALNRFEVILSVSDEDLPEAFRAERDAAQAAKDTSESATASRSGSPPTPPASSAQASDNSPPAGPRALPPGYRRLTISTPPSVRSHRAERVQAAIKALQQP